MDTSTGMFKRIWNSKPIMLVRAVFKIYGIIKTLGALGVSAIVPAAIVGGIASLGDAPGWLVFLIGAGGYILALVVIPLVLSRLLPVQQRIKDRELKQRCRKLAAELSEFSDRRLQEKPEAVLWPPNIMELGNYSRETKAQYAQRFGREVAIVLDALAQRGLLDSTERQKFEKPNMPQNIQNIQTLERRLATLCE